MRLKLHSPCFFQIMNISQSIKQTLFIITHIINMEHPYLQFYASNPNPAIINATLMISSIIQQPYSIVSLIAGNRSATPNLTYVPEIDTASDDQQVLIYFVIAIMLIVIVIYTFIQTTPEGNENKNQYRVPLKNSQILVLEEEELQDFS